MSRRKIKYRKEKIVKCDSKNMSREQILNDILGTGAIAFGLLLFGSIFTLAAGEFEKNG